MRFSNPFSYRIKHFSGAASFCRRAALTSLTIFSALYRAQNEEKQRLPLAESKNTFALECLGFSRSSGQRGQNKQGKCATTNAQNGSGQCLQSRGPATQWKTGRTTKMGKRWGKRGKFAPIENGKKMAEKYRKTGKSARFSIFSVFFGHFFPIFDRGKFSTFSPFFFPFLSFGPFSIVWQARAIASQCCTLHPVSFAVVLLKNDSERFLGFKLGADKDSNVKSSHEHFESKHVPEPFEGITRLGKGFEPRRLPLPQKQGKLRPWCPEKKIFSPPPKKKIPQFAAHTLPAPRPPSWKPPPLGIFNKKNRPPPPLLAPRTPPSPSPTREKIKNISETSTKSIKQGL